jgi:transcriptional regulator with XRE-family HTH domain
VPTIVKPPVPEAPEFSPRRLRAARRAAGLSLDALAERVGRRWSTVIRYEHGDAQPSVAVLGALAHVLGCSIDSLFEVDPPTSALDDPEGCIPE